MLAGEKHMTRWMIGKRAMTEISIELEEHQLINLER
jgi:hypothetical protein